MASIYDQPAELNLINTYVPIPFQEMAEGLGARQERYDFETSKIDLVGQGIAEAGAAGAADQALKQQINESFNENVMDKFRFGVDLTDAAVSAELDRTIKEYANNPLWKIMDYNAEIYPEIASKYRNARMEQPNSPHNWQHLEDLVTGFNELGSARIGQLPTDVEVPEAADVYGDLIKIVTPLRETGRSITEDGMTFDGLVQAYATSTTDKGVYLNRLMHIFGIDYETGEVEPQHGFMNTETGQEINRRTQWLLRGEEDATPEREEEVFNHLYVDTIRNFLESYAYDYADRGLELSKEGRDALTDTSGIMTMISSTSSIGTQNFMEESRKHDVSTVDRFILNNLEGMFTGVAKRGETDISQIVGNYFLDNIDEGISDRGERINSAIESGKREFVKAVHKPILQLLLPPIAEGAREIVGKKYMQTYGKMISQYAETLFDLAIHTSEDLSPLVSGVERSIESDHTLSRVRRTYDEMNHQGAFDALPVVERARTMNKLMYDHMSSLRQVHLEVPMYPSDSENYNKALGNTILDQDELSYGAERDGHARHLLSGKTGFNVDFHEVTIRNEIDKNDQVQLIGRLAANNPYGPGYYQLDVDGEVIFFEGTAADQEAQYMPWNLHGYDRQFSGVGEWFNARDELSGEMYEMRPIMDPLTDSLSIHYKKPGTDSFSTFSSGADNIIDLYIELIESLNK